jgi:hypothetical protein
MKENNDMTFFNPNEVELPDNESKSILPIGKYLAEISRVSQQDKSYGLLFTIFWKILHPIEFNGKQIPTFLCLRHTNPDAQRIANQNLKQICVAAGKDPTKPIEYPEEMIGWQIKIDIGHKADNKDPLKMNAHTKFFNPISNTELSILKEIDNLLRKKHEQEKQAEYAKMQAARNAPPKQKVVDDIPF